MIGHGTRLPSTCTHATLSLIGEPRGDPNVLRCCVANRITKAGYRGLGKSMHQTTKKGKSSLYCTPRVDRLGGIAKTFPVAFEPAPKRLLYCSCARDRS